MMDDETRRLLFTTSDGRRPSETDYATDALEFDDEDIDFERFPAIRALLTPGARNEELRVPLEAALVLAAWGDDAGFEYLKYVVGLPAADRHRAVGRGTIAEIGRAISMYRATLADRGRKAVDVQPVLTELFRMGEQEGFEVPMTPTTLAVASATNPTQERPEPSSGDDGVDDDRSDDA